MLIKSYQLDMNSDSRNSANLTWVEIDVLVSYERDCTNLYYLSKSVIFKK